MNNTVDEQSWDDMWGEVDRHAQDPKDHPENGGTTSTGVRRRESVLDPAPETVSAPESSSPIAHTVPYMRIVPTSAPAVSRVETSATAQFPQTLQPPPGTVPMTPEGHSSATASGIRRFEIAQAMARLSAQPMLLSGPTPVLGIDRRLLKQISNAPQVDPLLEASEPLPPETATRAAIPPPPLPIESVTTDVVKPGTVSILDDEDDTPTLKPVTRSYSEFQAPPPSLYERTILRLKKSYEDLRDRFRSKVSDVFSVKSFNSFLRPTFATLLLAAGFRTLAAHHGHHQQSHVHEASTTVQAPQTVHSSTVQHTPPEQHSPTVQEASVHPDTPQVVTSQTVTVSAKHDPHVTFVQAFTKFLTSHGSTPSNYHHHNPDANTMLHQLDQAGQGTLAYQLRHYTHDGDSFSFQRLSNGAIQLTGWHGHHSSYNRVSAPVTFSLPSH